MIQDVSFWAAFVAGLLSFLSPCVLPLVPPYLCFLTGRSLEELTDGGGAERHVRRHVLLAAMVFVLGFATVFVALGATASLVGQVLREHLDLLSKIAGVAIIIMGLHFLGLFKIGFLMREARYHHETRPPGFWGAYVIGLAFAFGWTPCIGPVLGAILAMAASEESVARGAMMLSVYSAGLGVPFVLAAAGINLFLAFMMRFRRHLGVMEKIMGGLLVLTGLMFLTGATQDIANWLIETFPFMVEEDWLLKLFGIRLTPSHP